MHSSDMKEYLDAVFSKTLNIFIALKLARVDSLLTMFNPDPEQCQSYFLGFIRAFIGNLAGFLFPVAQWNAILFPPMLLELSTTDDTTDEHVALLDRT